jgi:hypothetical protein
MIAGSPTRVYIAFDFADRNAAQLMGGQLRRPGTGYDVANWSLKEARPEPEWETDAEYQIKRSRLLMIVLGPETYRASGVLKEVAIARRSDVKVPCCQVAPSTLSIVHPVANGGRWYRWTHENIDRLITRVRREL